MSIWPRLSLIELFVDILLLNITNLLKFVWLKINCIRAKLRLDDWILANPSISVGADGIFGS